MLLFRVLMFAGVALLTVMFFKRVLGDRKIPSEEGMEDERLGRLVQDPECGVYVDGREAVRRKVPNGELFFCSEECATTHFQKAREGVREGK